MDLRDYFAMARRWAWLLALGLVFGATAGMTISFFQAPVYQSSTRILIMRAPQEKTNDYTYLSDQQLVQTYIQLLTTKPVIEGASMKLGFWVDSGQVSVQQIRDTQAIQLIVEDQDPQRAADIANIMVQVLIMQNEVIQAGRYATTEQSIQAQITQIEAQIAQLGSAIQNLSSETVQQQLQQVEAQIGVLQAEVTQLQKEIQALTPPTSAEQQAMLSEKQARLGQIEPVLSLYQQVYRDLVVLGKPVSSGDDTTRLAQMQSTLQLYQQIYVNLLNNLETIRLARLQNTPNVVQIEAATVPDGPVRPRPILNTGLGAAVGLLLAGAVSFLIDYVDDTIRTPEDIERILKLPIVGYIGDIRDEKGTVDEIHVLRHPRSPVAEAFRSLRTNLEFTNVDTGLSKILVTSPGPGEGKTTISTNLAIIMAQGGKRVLLIDADLRKPRVHSVFGISNRIGLSTLFRGQMTLKSAMRQVDGVEGVFVLTSGGLPPNPTELLASARMDQILEEAMREVDIIIIDSPPSLVADFQVLATKVDGVVLVIQPGYTHADTAVATVEQLSHVNARPLGAIFNKIPHNSYHYGGYYRYYYPYKRGGYYYRHEEGTELPVENQPANLLPLPQPEEESFIPEESGMEQFYTSERPRGTVDVYVPPNSGSASRNAITQPRVRAEQFQPVPTEPEAKKRPSKNEFKVWYLGQDDQRDKK